MRNGTLFGLVTLLLILAANLAAHSFYGSETPLRVKLSYTKNVLYYQPGDVETIKFTVYLNKSDSSAYAPGYRYLLMFKSLRTNNIYDTTLTVIDTSLIPEMVFLDDENSSFTGYIKMKCLEPRRYITYRVKSYRIVQPSEDKMYEFYPFIEGSDLKADEEKLITFKNPNYCELNAADLRTLDLDYHK